MSGVQTTARTAELYFGRAFSPKWFGYAKFNGSMFNAATKTATLLPGGSGWYLGYFCASNNKLNYLKMLPS